VVGAKLYPFFPVDAQNIVVYGFQVLYYGLDSMKFSEILRLGLVLVLSKPNYDLGSVSVYHLFFRSLLYQLSANAPQ